MCGIIGCIGKSKRPAECFNLTTHLLRETEVRGRDATGYFMVTDSGVVDFHKAPTPAHRYVKTKAWKRTADVGLALIGHTRLATRGNTKDNRNNHPFVSLGGNLGMVHNGTINDYSSLKKDYQLTSECDSEIILRIITREKDILRGIKKVFEILGPGGDFACQVLHRNPNSNKVTYYFFRDSGRPGKLIDARKTTGQIYICSEEEIWQRTLAKAHLSNGIHRSKVQNIQPYKILAIDAETLQIKEYSVPIPIRTKHRGYRRYSTTSGYWRGNYFVESWETKDPYPTTVYAHKHTTHYPTHEWKNPLSSSSGSKIDDDAATTELSNYHNKLNYQGSFDPDFLDPEDTSEAAMLRAAIIDPTKRWSGWEEEAVAMGIMTEEEAITMLYEEGIQRPDDNEEGIQRPDDDDDGYLIELAEEFDPYSEINLNLTGQLGFDEEFSEVNEACNLMIDSQKTSDNES